MRTRLALATGAVLAAAAWTAAAAPPPPSPAKCPLTPGVTPTAGDVQWAFTEFAPPNGSHPGITTSYTHGRGSWTSGRATGKACEQDSGSGPKRNVVLSIAGSARIKGHITRLGLLGVGMTLPVRVAKSDDSACAAGTRGTVTLFASYFAVHVDSIKLHFAAACANHNHTFTGSAVHVLITRHGAQVN